MKKYALIICLFIVEVASAKIIDEVNVLVNHTESNLANIWRHEAIDDSLQNNLVYDINLNGNISQLIYDLNYKDKENKLSINSMYIDFDLNDNLSFRVGKFIENWQIGFAFNPLAVTDPYYKTNSLLPLPGINAVLMNYNFENGNSINFYTNNDDNKLNSVLGYGYNSSAIRFNYILNQNSDLSIITHKKEGSELGIGAGVRSIIGDNLKVYGSFFTRKGTTLATHLGIVNNNPNLIATTNPIGQYRNNDGKNYPRVMLGLQYTTNNNLDIIIEANYDKRGMNDNEWDTYKSLINNHKNLPLPASKNLAWDFSLVSPRGLRQNYYFIRLSKPITEKYDVSFSQRIAKDLSAINNIELNYNVNDNILFNILFSKTTGKAQSEYQSYFPYDQELSVNLVYNFN
jgi:hypothetical protein